MPEVTGRLENWFWDEKHNIVWGDLYEDTRGRWREGQHIHTSWVQSHIEGQAREGDVIETLNSTYLLGKEFIKELTMG